MDFARIYAGFQAPIAALDCGDRCAPYNEDLIPFCCDTRHAVPAAYLAEWDYLRTNTDLWRIWQAEDAQETARLKDETPDGQILITCKGHLHCQRDYRSITCRSFPFFPYINGHGDFLGLSVYWEYADRCWVISNLEAVTPQYRAAFIESFEELFRLMPVERENFSQHSAYMRRVFIKCRRTIPLLHRDGGAYKISPGSESLAPVPVEDLPKYGDYKIAAAMPFPDELESVQ
jgi:hypothetical protein